jgi:UTP:GlnB (protein PII) uridylyltransferase
MDSLDRPHLTSDLADEIAQHLRHHPYDIRHVRKLMRHFHATAAEVELALNRIAAPFTLQIDPESTGDKVLLHFLRYPGDMINMRRVMRQLHASEGEVQQAFEKLETYIVEGGEGVVHAGTDKK